MPNLLSFLNKSVIFPTMFCVIFQITSVPVFSATGCGISLVDIVCLKWNSLDHCQWISVSTHSEQLYKEARDTERRRGRWGLGKEGSGYKQMNKWVKWGEGNLCFHRSPAPTPPSLLLDSRVYAVSALPLLLSLHCFYAHLPIEIALWH